MLCDTTRVVRYLNLAYHEIAIGRPVGCCYKYSAGASVLR